MAVSVGFVCVCMYVCLYACCSVCISLLFVFYITSLSVYFYVCLYSSLPGLVFVLFFLSFSFSFSLSFSLPPPPSTLSDVNSHLSLCCIISVPGTPTPQGHSLVPTAGPNAHFVPLYFSHPLNPNDEKYNTLVLLCHVLLSAIIITAVVCGGGGGGGVTEIYRMFHNVVIHIFILCNLV